MATVPTQIRIDAHVKEEAAALFVELGLDMSSAVNIFLRQCILHGGLPFSVEVPSYDHAELEARVEAERAHKTSHGNRSIPSSTKTADRHDA